MARRLRVGCFFDDEMPVTEAPVGIRAVTMLRGIAAFSKATFSPDRPGGLANAARASEVILARMGGLEVAQMASLRERSAVA